MIVFGEDWGRHPSSTQHIMRRLAEDRKMIWVNSLGLRRPRFGRRDLARLVSKANLLFAAREKQETSGLAPVKTGHPFAALLNPQALPFPGSQLAAAFNRKSLTRQIGSAMQKSDFDRPILWTSLPTALPVVGQLGERAVVYYAGDDFAALAGVDHKPVLEAERKLAEKADLILAASREIASRFNPGKTGNSAPRGRLSLVC